MAVLVVGLPVGGYFYGQSCVQCPRVETVILTHFGPLSFEQGELDQEHEYIYTGEKLEQLKAEAKSHNAAMEALMRQFFGEPPAAEEQDPKKRSDSI